MVCLLQLLQFFLGISSLPPIGEEDEEVPPPAVDTEEAAPPPPLGLQAGPGPGIRFTSAFRSTFTRASRASTRLSSKIRLAFSRAHGNQALPIRSPCPVPSDIQGGPPSPLPPPQAEPTSTANIGEDSPLHLPAMVFRPNYRLYHQSNLPAAWVRFHVTPGHLGSNPPFLCHAIGIDITTSDQRQGWPTPPVYLGETFLNLSYQAVVALLIFHFQSTSSSNNSSTAKQPAALLLAAEVTVVLGFAASLIGVLLREVCGKVAVAIERMGSVVAAVGFFLMVGMLFSTSISRWVGVLCGGASLIAFMLPLIKKKRE